MSDKVQERGYLLAVAPTRFGDGLASLTHQDTAEFEMLHPIGFCQAFTRVWETDAHFYTYRVYGPDGPEDVWPRLIKPPRGIVLNEIRAAGGDVKVCAFVWDWDTSKLSKTGEKEPINSVSLATFWDLMLDLPDSVREWALKFTYYYTTKNGIRLVYALTTPIPCDKAEALHKFLTRQLREGGVFVDELSDWTRSFRLPRITRRDHPGDVGYVWPTEDSFFEEVWQDLVFDPIALVGEGILSVPSVVPAVLDYPQPTVSDVQALIGTEGERPDWWTSVKKLLKEKHCYTTLYEHRLMAQVGTRDMTLIRFVGEVCVAMAKAKKSGHPVGPSQVYALLYNSVAQLEADADTPDWTVKCWRTTLKYWAVELAKIEERAIQKEANHLIGMSLTDRIVQGMKEWCQAPELRQEGEAARAWATQHFLVYTPGERVHVIKPDGTYDFVGVRDNKLKARIRELGMETAIPLGYDTDKGFVSYPPGTLLERHGTAITQIEGHAAGPGNWVKGLRTDHATMVLRLYRRKTDLQPKFHEKADKWLRMLCGNDTNTYRRLTTYTGWALAFDEGPIAAAALIGARGAGKKMYAQALAECITTELVADSGDMGKFGANLMRTPFIVINEGMKKSREGYDPADYFRLLTGGDPLMVERKFMDPVLIRAPFRVILLANNTDILVKIAGHDKNLSMDDKAALAQRLFVIRINEEAPSWLRAQGGERYTRGWISKDAGGVNSSDYVLAEHFMWLYQNRPDVEFGNRFLVEGDTQEDIVQTLSTLSGQAPQVIEIICAIVEQLGEGRAVEGAYLQTAPLGGVPSGGGLPKVWVTPHAVAAHARTHQAGPVINLQPREIQKVLRGMVRSGDPEIGYELTLPSSRGPRRAYWYHLHLEQVLQQAWQLGFKCHQVEALVTREHHAKVIAMQANA